MTSYRTAFGLALISGLFTLFSQSTARAVDAFSDTDKAFVAKVSQGGMFETLLGTYATTAGQTQDIRDSGATEMHDHQLVGDKLKSIMEANGMQFPTGLNPEFEARLEKLKALPPEQFDAAYLADMKKIHDADGAAFAKEAKHGSSTDLKVFAAETYKIVQRHLGELNASVK